MALTIGDLVGFIRADDSGMRRGLDDAELRMRGFQRDTEGRLRHLDGTFATLGEQIAAGLRRGDDEGRRFGLSLGRLAGMAGGLAGVAMSVGKIAAMLGAAVPLAAGLVATLANIAPAAGLAVTGMFAVLLATNALKLGMQGVGDALKLALDPSKGEEFAKALEKLSPNARAFAKEVKSLAPEFKKLQQNVQDRLFKGLASVLREMGKDVLPVLSGGLKDAADSLNSMAVGVGRSASSLARNGTLGTAIAGANAGLRNLSRAPGQFVTAITQVGAAAAPAFGRLTAAAGKGLDSISQKITKAFQSGAMEKAIEQAITLIGQLASIAGNVFSVLGSVFSAAQASGGGFIGVLQQITGALADAFASPAVQSGLKAIFQTMATVATTVAPLLISALQGIAPVFTALGPPVQTVVKALGAALGPIIKALGPVLASAAKAVGALLVALSPLLPVIGQLVAALLPALTPLFDALNKVFVALAPVIAQIATTLGATLAPIIAGLTPIIAILAKTIGDQLVIFIGMLGELIVALSPTLIQLGEIFGELLVAVAPLIQTLGDLATKLLTELMPFIQPLIELIAELAAMFADELAEVIRTVVIPAIEMIVALLQGDFSGAWDAAKRLVSGAIDTMVRWLTQFPQKAWAALSSFGSKLGQRAQEAGTRLRTVIAQKIGEAVAKVRELPGKAMAALGNLGSKLYGSGKALIRGFIDGIKDMAGSVGDAVSGVLSKARNLLPFSPAKEGPFSGKGWTLYSGQAISQALAAGIASGGGRVQGAMGSVLAGAQSALAGAPLGLSMGGAVPGMAFAGAGRVQAPPVRVALEVRAGDSSGRTAQLVEDIRAAVTVRGGGDVQRTFGDRR
ncbi:phage tail protein [Streptomyces lunaelactis]|uniref:phage tail protein n=1 Tax=Streptomyces lunaelactis TaxID=1535768 RepID=UPI001584DEEB|nr:hypothetical protein [Streptomyces lunaelactis]NUK22074.1 hypothetical protein [Streptomyces lunaelactis]